MALVMASGSFEPWDMSMVSDHSSSRSQSLGSKPSMSAIMTRGSGAAMSATRSHAPFSHTRSMISSQTWRMRGSRSRTAWGVNPALTDAPVAPVFGGVHVDHVGQGVPGRDPPAFEKTPRVLAEGPDVLVAGRCPTCRWPRRSRRGRCGASRRRRGRVPGVELAVHEVDVWGPGVAIGTCLPWSLHHAK